MIIFQTTKFFKFKINFTPTDCFACLGSSGGGYKSEKTKKMDKNTI